MDIVAGKSATFCSWRVTISAALWPSQRSAPDRASLACTGRTARPKAADRAIPLALRGSCGDLMRPSSSLPAKHPGHLSTVAGGDTIRNFPCQLAGTGWLARRRSASSVSVDCFAAGGRDLLLHRFAPAEGATGPAIPIERVVEVALERMDDAMQPGGQRGVVFLHDVVGRLPVAGREQVQSAEQIAVRHASRSSRSRPTCKPARCEYLRDARRPREQRPDARRSPPLVAARRAVSRSSSVLAVRLVAGGRE